MEGVLEQKRHGFTPTFWLFALALARPRESATGVARRKQALPPYSSPASSRLSLGCPGWPDTLLRTHSIDRNLDTFYMHIIASQLPAPRAKRNIHARAIITACSECLCPPSVVVLVTAGTSHDSPLPAARTGDRSMALLGCPNHQRKGKEQEHSVSDGRTRALGRTNRQQQTKKKEQGGQQPQTNPSKRPANQTPPQYNKTQIIIIA